jgi:hypothetical protein
MELPPHPARTFRLWGITLDWRITQLVVLSTLLLLFEYYRPDVLGLPQAYNRFVWHFVVPAALIVLVWREDLRTYGLRVGDWRLGVPITVAAIAVMAVVIYVIGRNPDFGAYYARLLNGRGPLRIVVDEGFELFSWEFMCRGWLLYGLARKYGTDAIWLQVVPFAMMHLTKPEVEVLSTVFGGLLFGLLAWRTRSFLYGWVIHWFMAAFMFLVAGGFV